MKSSAFLPLATVAAGLITLPASAQIVFDFSASDQGWAAAVESGSATNPFHWSATGGSGGSGAWVTEGVQAVSVKTLTSPTFNLQATGSVSLTLNHLWDFEATGIADGGQVLFRVNGGSWTPLARGDFSSFGYDAGGAGISALGGADGWAKRSGCCEPEFVESVASLGTFSAGDTLQIQLRAGWDISGIGGNPNWAISRVEIHSLAPIPEPTAIGLAVGAGLLGFSLWRKTRNC